jgi:hypothetical protein
MHEEAEAAVRKLEKGGVPIAHVSIIGRDFWALVFSSSRLVR